MPYNVTELEHAAEGSKAVRYARINFTGNYPNEGEPVLVADFGLATIASIEFFGPATAADGESAVLVDYDPAAKVIRAFESAATGLAVIEKTAAEAYPTGATVQVRVRGN